jgi:hypothetical protein
MSGGLDMFWTVALSVSAFIVIGFSWFARWCGYSPAVSYKNLHALHVGMTTAEVTALLGAPREKRAGDDGSEFWVYGARWKRHVLVTEFNGKRELKNFVHGIPNPRRSARLIED